jgi:hypothetical protein
VLAAGEEQYNGAEGPPWLDDDAAAAAGAAVVVGKWWAGSISTRGRGCADLGENRIRLGYRRRLRRYCGEGRAALRYRPRGNAS